MRANEQLIRRMRTHETLLCVGLDPDLRKLPPEVLRGLGSNEEKVFEFLRGVVDATGQNVCSYKVQKAFFDLLPGGHDVLKGVIQYVHEMQPQIPVFVDCKIGDIENTMSVYIENIFGHMQADGVVVNPYMGDDVMAPLMELTDKAVITLVKTSNISGSVVQNLVLHDGRLLWQHLLDLVVGRWNRNGNMIPVLSANAGLDMAQLRPLIPNAMPILLAGVGAQGGGYGGLCDLLNSEGVGVFVNSSRGILYHASDVPWREAVENAALEMKTVINLARSMP